MLLQRSQRKISSTVKLIRGSIQSRLLYPWLIHRQSQPLAPTTKSALIFAPHQDDETLGCGGLIAQKRSQGIPVWVVFLTNGDASHLYDPAGKTDHLVETRIQETIAALRILGINPTETTFLNYPDGQLQNLSEAAKETLVQTLVQLIDTLRPQEIYFPHSQDAHPDHEQTHTLVQIALTRTLHHPESWQYPIWILWSRTLGIDLKWQTIAQPYCLNIQTSLTQKKQALRLYSSQHPVLPKSFIQHFYKPYELFFKLH